MSALEALTRVYLEPTPPAAGAVGYVGADVPAEVIAAAGFLPERLRSCSFPQAPDERVLGPGVDPPARRILAGLLAGRPGPSGLLVLCHDSDSTVRLYTSLRALTRIGEGSSLPALHFLDLLHLPTETTTAYNARRVADLIGALAGRSGRSMGEDDLRRAIAEGNETRRLLAGVQALRRVRPAVLSGVDALAVIGAGTALAAPRYNALLAALLAEAPELEPRPGRRVYMTGSGHEEPEAYRAVERRGAVIVGEDHDWGEAIADGLIDEEAEPVAAIAARYGGGSAPARRHSSRARAAYTAREAEAAGADLVVSWIRSGDDVHAWDIPEQRSLLGERGIPLVVLEHRDDATSTGATNELEGALA